MTDLAPLASELRHRRIPSAVAEDLLRRQQAVADRPTSAVAEHNFATGLGDAGFWKAAEHHVRAAFTKVATLSKLGSCWRESCSRTASRVKRRRRSTKP
jgi:hypothetical protein